MAEEKMMRLSQVARKLNIGKDTIVEFLAKKGHEVENNPNAKVNGEQFQLLSREFAASAMDKEEASSLTIGRKENKNVVVETDAAEPEESTDASKEEEEIRIKSTTLKPEEAEQKEAPAPKEEAPKKAEAPKAEEKPAEENKAEEDENRLKGIKVLGKIDLDAVSGKKPKAAEKKEKPEAAEKKAEKPAAPEKATEKPTAEKKEEPVAEKKTEKPAAEEKAAKPQEPKPEKKEEKKEEVKAEKPAEKPAPKKQEDKTVEQPTKEAAAPAAEKPADKEKPAKETPKASEEAPAEEKDTIKAKADNLKGLTVLGKIDLPTERKKGAKPVASSDDKGKKKKQKRKRISNQPGSQQGGGGGRGPQQGRGPGGKPQRGGKRPASKPAKEEPTDKEIQEQIKETLARLSGSRGGKFSSRAKHRRDKRSAAAEAEEERRLQAQEEAKVLKVTEYISANDLASLMNVSVNDIIAACMSLGMFVSINQRLDAEAITVIADEFGYNVDFTSADDEAEVEEEEDAPEDLQDRAPIVTIMGHVDHGKTSLLDYIRRAKVAAGEAGGITQHIGAYDVNTESGKRISFLDTPGHEAFTAMRARGAKVTDVVIIVVAADDAVMPQTKEAINHAQVAGAPIIIAINKVDRPTANPEKIKEELANMNILVEDWGGKYQCQEISAKTGQGVEDLLEKVLLEAELLELKANPEKAAQGTVIEASLDKGRGYVSTLLVQAGTMRVGDIVLAGQHHGRVKAMFDHRGNRLKEAGPSTPVQMLGLGGAPQAGDKFNVMETEREAREIATKREQILREQSMRTKKHVTLDEIGRRLAIGNFKELNVIVKGDVDGSVEALSDSLLKLSTEEIQVNIIHKGVGQISESDILLATASDAIVVGFQVRPSPSARKLAENEEIEIRLYSIIYDAINEVKAAMEGMLAPEFEEVITGNIEVREVFKISKVGTVAGCYVTDGYVKRNNKIRLIRDGIVIYTGDIDALKRFKDDVQEVRSGYECGLSIKNFNDIKVGDIIEGFTQQEIKRKL